MTLIAVMIFVGMLVTPAFSGIVYFDAARSKLPASRRLGYAVTVAVASFGGFLVPYAFGDRLTDLYLRMLKPEPIVTSPYELLVASLVTGLLIGTVPVVLYFTASRYRTLHRR